LIFNARLTNELSSFSQAVRFATVTLFFTNSAYIAERISIGVFAQSVVMFFTTGTNLVMSAIILVGSKVPFITLLTILRTVSRTNVVSL